MLNILEKKSLIKPKIRISPDALSFNAQKMPNPLAPRGFVEVQPAYYCLRSPQLHTKGWQDASPQNPFAPSYSKDVKPSQLLSPVSNVEPKRHSEPDRNFYWLPY